MSKKDYVLIASVLEMSRCMTSAAGHRALCEAMAARLAAAHTGYPFSHSKFLTACGVEGSQS